MRKTTRWLLPSLLGLLLVGLWVERNLRVPPPPAPLSPIEKITNVSAAPAVLPPRSHPASVSAAHELSAEEVAKARSEIKMSLSALYGAEKAFHDIFHRYTTDLLHGADFIPRPLDGVRWSKVGFLSPFSPRELSSPLEDPRFLDSDSYLAHVDGGEPPFTYAASAQDISLRDWGSFCEHGCTANERHFEIIAVSQFRPGQPPEIWTINDHKVLRQAQNGLGDEER